jgi:serine/threonine protein kinase
MFSDFISGLLHIDPEQRWTAWQALRHPFITGAEYEGPYIPDPDPLKHMLKETSISPSLPNGGFASIPSVFSPNGDFGDFALSSGTRNSSFVPKFSEAFEVSGGYSSYPAMSSSLPVQRSNPQAIPSGSEWKESYVAHSYGDSSEIGSSSMRDSNFLSSGSSLSSQFSYHSPYTYGQEIPRLTNFPSDYSWSDRKSSNAGK